MQPTGSGQGEGARPRSRDCPPADGPLSACARSTTGTGGRTVRDDVIDCFSNGSPARVCHQHTGIPARRGRGRSAQYGGIDAARALLPDQSGLGVDGDTFGGGGSNTGSAVMPDKPLNNVTIRAYNYLVKAA